MTDGFQPPLFALFGERIDLREGMSLLRHFFDPADIMAELDAVLKAAPLRHMQTPSGKTMSVAMSNCGDVGWVSSRAGYAYAEGDPSTGKPWPAIPETWRAAARKAASLLGFQGFAPDCCLINEYRPGTQLSLHQDHDEQDFSQPIVSLSLGLPARFVIGGLKRSDPTKTIVLQEGDALVFGGPSRLIFHGVRPLKPDAATKAERRINLTFRRAR